MADVAHHLPQPAKSVSAGGRLPLVDVLKALASQLIVLHHLAFYGPMSDYARSLVPDALDWFYAYARIAVQVFLVIGGFLAAQSLQRQGCLDSPLRLLWRRYLKLVLPYLVALLLAIAAAAIARHLMNHPATPAAPTLAQFLAHLLLLQGISELLKLVLGRTDHLAPMEPGDVH